MKEPKDFKILIACEESQVVCIEFRKLGFEAYSCDIQECSGGHPEWHLQMDVFKAIEIIHPDLMIGHPPCDHLAVSGAAWFEIKRKDGRQQQGIDFFMKLVNTNIKHIAIENPICIMSSVYRKPDQIIQPYYFGDNVPKKTCLWLKGLPPLLWSNGDMFNEKTTVDPEYFLFNSAKTKSGKSKYSVFGKLGKGHSKERSKTFPGIAKAMATQYGQFLLNQSK